MPSDSYPGTGKILAAPSERCGTVTPDDDADLSEIPKYIYVGAQAGTVIMRDRHGNQATFYGAAGQKIEFRPVRIFEASTASPIIACY